MNNFKILLVLIGLCVSATSNSNSAHNQPNPQLPLELRLSQPKPYQQLPQTINSYNIHDLFEQYQKRAAKFSAIKDDYIATFDLLMDKNMVVEGIELRKLLGKAMATNTPLNEFETIGLYQKNIHHYLFNSTQCLHFLEPFDLSVRLTIKSLQNSNHEKLKHRGFRKSDIVKLKRYLAQKSPVWNIDKYAIEFLQPRIKQLKEQIQSQDTKATESYDTTFAALDYHNSYITSKLWRQWILNLLSQFAPQQQRILKSFMIEQIKGERAISLGSFTGEREDWQRIISGEFEQTMRNRYKQLTQKDLIQ